VYQYFNKELQIDYFDCFAIFNVNFLSNVMLILNDHKSMIVDKIQIKI